MTLTIKLVTRCAIALLLLAAASSLATAQLNSNAQPIALTATLPESLTVGLSASAVTFNLTAGAAANPGNIGVTATTTWVLRPSRTTLRVYAYFANSAAALSDGGAPANNIPSAAFFISNNGGASTAVNQSVVFGGANAGLQLSSTAITAANRAGNRTDAMVFNINLTTLPQLPAGTYTGTLNIQAQATP